MPADEQSSAENAALSDDRQMRTVEMSPSPAASAPLDMAHGSLPNPSPEAVAVLGSDAPTATVVADPALEKAISHGYVEAPAPSRDDRVKALIADVEHAMANNGPMTPAMLGEMRDLLLS